METEMMSRDPTPLQKTTLKAPKTNRQGKQEPPPQAAVWRLVPRLEDCFTQDFKQDD